MISQASLLEPLSGNDVLDKNQDHKPSVYAGLWSFGLGGDNILITEFIL